MTRLLTGDAFAGQDVERPEACRDEGEGYARQIGTQRCGFRAVPTEDHDGGRGRNHAAEVAWAAGECRREHQRSSELDGDCDTERDAGDRGKEEAVHARQCHRKQRC